MQLRLGLVFVPYCDHADKLGRVADPCLVQLPLDALHCLADLPALQHVLVNHDDTNAIVVAVISVRVQVVDTGAVGCHLLDEVEGLLDVRSKHEVVTQA